MVSIKPFQAKFTVNVTSWDMIFTLVYYVAISRNFQGVIQYMKIVIADKLSRILEVCTSLLYMWNHTSSKN